MNCEQLEIFSNAMLAVNLIVPVSHPEDILYGDTYSEYYLYMMCAGNDSLLERDTALLASMNEEMEGYPELAEQHSMELSMMNLWMAQASVMCEFDETEGDSDLYHHRIEGLTYKDNGCFTFDMYCGFFQGDEETEAVMSIETVFFLSPLAVSGAIYGENCRDVSREMEWYYRNIAVRGFLDVVMALLEKGLPEKLKVLVGVTEAVLDTDDIVSDYMKMENELTELTNDEWARWFEIGGGYTVNGNENEKRFSFHGVYDPETYRRMQVIEDAGLGELMGWDEIIVDEELGITILEAKRMEIENVGEGTENTEDADIEDEDSVTEDEGSDAEDEETANIMDELKRKLLYGGFSFHTMSYTTDDKKEVKVTLEQLINALTALGAEECMYYGRDQ